MSVSTPVYIALDFETADYAPDSACAIGLAKIRDHVVIDTCYSLIRPPRKTFFFTGIHGITWNQVKDSPSFSELWPELAVFMAQGTHLLAHNAPFDKRVLEACCRAADIPIPDLPFLCTLKAARKAWSLPSYKLDALCSHLGIPLQHHHAGADALAAAELWLRLEAQSLETQPR